MMDDKKKEEAIHALKKKKNIRENVKECKKKIDGERFCYRCVLDEEEGIDYNDIEEITLPDGGTFVQIGQGSIFLGSLDEYWESEEKVKGWLIAQEVIFDNLDNFK